jgi:hypothetical protein
VRPDQTVAALIPLARSPSLQVLLELGLVRQTVAAWGPTAAALCGQRLAPLRPASCTTASPGWSVSAPHGPCGATPRTLLVSTAWAPAGHAWGFLQPGDARGFLCCGPLPLFAGRMHLEPLRPATLLFHLMGRPLWNPSPHERKTVPCVSPHASPAHRLVACLQLYSTPEPAPPLVSLRIGYRPSMAHSSPS